MTTPTSAPYRLKVSWSQHRALLVAAGRAAPVPEVKTLTWRCMERRGLVVRTVEGRVTGYALTDFGRRCLDVADARRQALDLPFGSVTR